MFDKRFQRGQELEVTVGSNSDENLIVFGDRVLWKFFLDYLVKVDLDCIAVIFKCIKNLVQDCLALKKDSPAHSRDNIHNAVNALPLSVKAQASHFGRG